MKKIPTLRVTIPLLVLSVLAFGRAQGSEVPGKDAALHPFGCPLISEDCAGRIPVCGGIVPLSEWPGLPERPLAEKPLEFDRWAGPYWNESGKAWIEQINAWYREGTAAGLTQDTFRSFDGNHSGLRRFYPQLKKKKALRSYHNACAGIFMDRVTLGVQSFGVRDGMLWSVIEHTTRKLIQSGNGYGLSPNVTNQSFYKSFYEHNFLLVAPATGSYTARADRFSFLSPFYLHSIGRSGSDAKLLKPIVFASAALPPEVKTRMMRKGVYVPTLMYLFKSSITGDLRSPAAHVPAYGLSKEAGKDFTGPTPFLDRLVNSAHSLSHIPPVARIVLVDFRLETDGTINDHAPYYEDSAYGFAGVLRKGERLVLTVDLSLSWTDDGQSVAGYYADVLRGAGSIEVLNAEKSVLKITVPWMETRRLYDYRTDILLLVNDGVYDSAPAYISVRHIQTLETGLLGDAVRGVVHR